jgi:hypothetical protein
MTSKQGPVQGDRPTYKPIGDFRSVDGILLSLGVAKAGFTEQRKAVQRAWGISSLRPLLRKQEDELRSRNLL